MRESICAGNECDVSNAQHHLLRTSVHAKRREGCDGSVEGVSGSLYKEEKQLDTYDKLNRGARTYEGVPAVRENLCLKCILKQKVDRISEDSTEESMGTTQSSDSVLTNDLWEVWELNNNRNDGSKEWNSPNRKSTTIRPNVASPPLRSRSLPHIDAGAFETLLSRELSNSVDFLLSDGESEVDAGPTRRHSSPDLSNLLSCSTTISREDPVIESRIDCGAIAAASQSTRPLFEADGNYDDPDKHEIAPLFKENDFSSLSSHAASSQLGDDLVTDSLSSVLSPVYNKPELPYIFCENIYHIRSDSDLRGKYRSRSHVRYSQDDLLSRSTSYLSRCYLEEIIDYFPCKDDSFLSITSSHDCYDWNLSMEPPSANDKDHLTVSMKSRGDGDDDGEDSEPGYSYICSGNEDLEGSFVCSDCGTTIPQISLNKSGDFTSGNDVKEFGNEFKEKDEFVLICVPGKKDGPLKECIFEKEKGVSGCQLSVYHREECARHRRLSGVYGSLENIEETVERDFEDLEMDESNSNRILRGTENGDDVEIHGGTSGDIAGRSCGDDEEFIVPVTSSDLNEVKSGDAKVEGELQRRLTDLQHAERSLVSVEDEVIGQFNERFVKDVEKENTNCCGLSGDQLGMERTYDHKRDNFRAEDRKDDCTNGGDKEQNLCINCTESKNCEKFFVDNNGNCDEEIEDNVIEAEDKGKAAVYIDNEEEMLRKRRQKGVIYLTNGEDAEKDKANPTEEAKIFGKCESGNCEKDDFDGKSGKEFDLVRKDCYKMVGDLESDICENKDARIVTESSGRKAKSTRLDDDKEDSGASERNTCYEQEAGMIASNAVAYEESKSAGNGYDKSAGNDYDKSAGNDCDKSAGNDCDKSAGNDYDKSPGNDNSVAVCDVGIEDYKFEQSLIDESKFNDERALSSEKRNVNMYQISQETKGSDNIENGVYNDWNRCLIPNDNPDYVQNEIFGDMLSNSDLDAKLKTDRKCFDEEAKNDVEHFVSPLQVVDGDDGLRFAGILPGDSELQACSVARRVGSIRSAGVNTCSNYTKGNSRTEELLLMKAEADVRSDYSNFQSKEIYDTRKPSHVERNRSYEKRMSDSSRPFFESRPIFRHSESERIDSKYSDCKSCSEERSYGCLKCSCERGISRSACESLISNDTGIEADDVSLTDWEEFNQCLDATSSVEEVLICSRAGRRSSTPVTRKASIDSHANRGEDVNAPMGDGSTPTTQGKGIANISLVKERTGSLPLNSSQKCAKSLKQNEPISTATEGNDLTKPDEKLSVQDAAKEGLVEFNGQCTLDGSRTESEALKCVQEGENLSDATNTSSHYIASLTGAFCNSVEARQQPTLDISQEERVGNENPLVKTCQRLANDHGQTKFAGESCFDVKLIIYEDEDSFNLKVFILHFTNQQISEKESNAVQEKAEDIGDLSNALEVTFNKKRLKFPNNDVTVCYNLGQEAEMMEVDGCWFMINPEVVASVVMSTAENCDSETCKTKLANLILKNVCLHKTCSFHAILNWILVKLGFVVSESHVNRTKNASPTLHLLSKLVAEPYFEIQFVRQLSFAIARPRIAKCNEESARRDFLLSCLKVEVNGFSFTCKYPFKIFVSVQMLLSNLGDAYKTAFEALDNLLVLYLHEQNCLDFASDVLIYLGLIKSEFPVNVANDKKTCLHLLSHVSKQTYFPLSGVFILDAFIKKSGDFIDAVVLAQSGLELALRTRMDKEVCTDR